MVNRTHIVFLLFVHFAISAGLILTVLTSCLVTPGQETVPLHCRVQTAIRANFGLLPWVLCISLPGFVGLILLKHRPGQVRPK